MAARRPQDDLVSQQGLNMDAFPNVAPPFGEAGEPKIAVRASELAIEVRRVSKRFKLYNDVVTGPLKELIFFWRREQYRTEFLAVNDVSFTVRRGEVVGIIGPNGAGKSTMLKMIAGLLPIDSGTVAIRGRVTALLALGVGVHPEFTGRENIYFSGLLLGMPKEEIAAKTHSIVEFAEVGDFIDRPLRTYSTGMRARLLFSIAMSIEPDILIIDEALAAGDAYFVTKSTRRIRELCESGATILFVSHNLTQVRQLCSRALFMAEGRVVAEGEPAAMICRYNEWAFGKEEQNAMASAIAVGAPKPVGGSGKVRIEAVRLKDAAGHSIGGAYAGASVTLEIDYSSDLPTGKAVTFFAGIVRTSDQQWVGEISSNYLLGSLESDVKRIPVPLYPQGKISVTLRPLLLVNNHYEFWIMISSAEELYELYCEYRSIAPFFAARRVHVFDRDPVFLQPSQIESCLRENESVD
jgi:ABC-type polysaccharide/polyol phosphate transport system ATPase subunit